MPRIAKADVNAALVAASKAILNAGGSNGRVSRAEVTKALPSLPKAQRKLVDIFFRFVDHRDFKNGAQVTKADLARAVEYAKKHMVAKYDLDGNGLSRSEIARMSLTGKLAVDVARELKKAGQVDGPTTGPVSDTAAAAAIEAAITHDGANKKLTKEVTLAEVPANVRDDLKAAGKQISDRTFGTDYSADVEGYYAVFKSATDKTTVGYAVKGYGSGEPDYSDSTIIGFNLAGKRVFEDQQDW